MLSECHLGPSEASAPIRFATALRVVMISLRDARTSRLVKVYGEAKVDRADDGDFGNNADVLTWVNECSVNDDLGGRALTKRCGKARVSPSRGTHGYTHFEAGRWPLPDAS